MASGCQFDRNYVRLLLPRFHVAHLVSSDAVKKEKKESVYRMADYLKQCRDQGALNLSRVIDDMPARMQPEMNRLVKKASDKVFVSKK